MMNKKGVSFGRIILYCLFLTLIALFVFTLFITFKAMKKKDNTTKRNTLFIHHIYQPSLKKNGKT